MFEHRTITQRLGDHDVLIAELLLRVEQLEAAAKAKPVKPARADEVVIGPT